MNKAEFIDAIAKDADLTKVAAARALDAAITTITKTLAAGGSVALIGFGTFKPSARAARTGRNPSTGATLEIAATTLPKFTPGQQLKDAVAKSKPAAKAAAKPVAKPAAKPVSKPKSAKK